MAKRGPLARSKRAPLLGRLRRHPLSGILSPDTKHSAHLVPLVTLIYLFALPSLGTASERIVTLGGPVTEIVFALGAGEAVVAVDQSSAFPPEVSSLPQVGYVSAVSAEGILAMAPTRLITTNRIGPPATVSQLRASRIPLDIIPNPNDLESLRAAITAIGRSVGREAAAAELWTRIEGDLERVREMPQPATAPRTAFLLGNAGVPLAAGRETQAHGILTLAGAQNMFAGQIGYKPVSEEALIEAGLTHIFVGTHQPEAGADARVHLRRLGLQNLARSPDLRVDALDLTRFLTFGPRTGEAALELAAILYGAPAKPSTAEARESSQP